MTYIDTYQMPYDQWQGGRLTTVQHGRFRITPPWEISGNASGKTQKAFQILLDPGVVFGNGTHPTTRDCLQALELAAGEIVPARVLDLGTGTGLLAVAAAKLGCQKILAVELNLLAAQTAHKNVCLNNCQDRVVVVQAKAEDYSNRPAELLVANIHYAVMRQFIGCEHFFTKKKFILSGLLRDEARDLIQQLRPRPVKILKTWAADGIWHTFYGKID